VSEYSAKETDDGARRANGLGKATLNRIFKQGKREGRGRTPGSIRWKFCSSGKMYHHSGKNMKAAGECDRQNGNKPGPVLD